MTLFLATWREPGQVAVETAWRRHLDGGDLRDCLEAGLAACELDPNFVAIGLGSLPNADGELELDAAMMDGRHLNAGAVCSLRGIVPAISVARKVMEETPHVMLSGEQARRFAISKGFAPQNLMTAENIRRYEEWKVSQTAHEDEYVHAVNLGAGHHGDTVTMLGWQDGHLVSASATSGLAWKMPGRVGDSPIVGAGVYADDERGAAGATGWGEDLWRAAASYRAVDNLSRGMSADDACEDVAAWMRRRIPHSREVPCVVFAVSPAGDFGAATTAGEFPLWICRDGDVSMRLYTASA